LIREKKDYLVFDFVKIKKKKEMPPKKEPPKKKLTKKELRELEE
jgi:hypothetical protein